MSEAFKVRSIHWQAVNTPPWLARRVEEREHLECPVDRRTERWAEPGEYIMQRVDEREQHVIQEHTLWRYYERINE